MKRKTESECVRYFETNTDDIIDDNRLDKSQKIRIINSIIKEKVTTPKYVFKKHINVPSYIN